MNAQELRDRTQNFAIDIIRFAKTIPSDPVNNVLMRQLVRSVTSVASNYRAAGRSRSKAEFYSKLCIVVEEADETLFWIELIQETKSTGDGAMLFKIKKEAQELLKIFSSARKSMKESALRH
jgi:four helix bundle protein